jgi:hypothetical protein
MLEPALKKTGGVRRFTPRAPLQQAIDRWRCVIGRATPAREAKQGVSIVLDVVAGYTTDRLRVATAMTWPKCAPSLSRIAPIPMIPMAKAARKAVTMVPCSRSLNGEAGAGVFGTWRSTRLMRVVISSMGQTRQWQVPIWTSEAGEAVGMRRTLGLDERLKMVALALAQLRGNSMLLRSVRKWNGSATFCTDVEGGDRVTRVVSI